MDNLLDVSLLNVYIGTVYPSLILYSLVLVLVTLGFSWKAYLTLSPGLWWHKRISWSQNEGNCWCNCLSSSSLPCCFRATRNIWLAAWLLAVILLFVTNANAHNAWSQRHSSLRFRALHTSELIFLQIKWLIANLVLGSWDKLAFQIGWQKVIGRLNLAY